MEKKLKKISKQLKGASKLHAGQAKKIDNMIKKGPFKMKGPGLKTGDKISKKPTSGIVKTTRNFQNVTKGFKSQGAKAVKKITPKIMKRVVRAGATINRLNPLSAALGAVGTAVYNQGQKRTGGKIRKGQKTNTMGFGKKSIFKK